MYKCNDFVCKYKDSCINEPVCELYKCPRCVPGACNVCVNNSVCHIYKNQKHN